MLSKTDLYNNYELWGSVFFNAKNTEFADISNKIQKDLLSYFNGQANPFIKDIIADIFPDFEVVGGDLTLNYIRSAPAGVKYIRFPRYKIKLCEKDFLIAFRMNICKSLNLIKIFYYLQSSTILTETTILRISKEARSKLKSIASNIEKVILNDNKITNLFDKKIKRDVFDLYICNVNTTDHELEGDIQKLIADFDKDMVRSNEKIQHTLMFLYNLDKDKAVRSLSELRNEIILNYTDNQFTTTEVSGLKGFYVYYIKQNKRSGIVYSGIAPYKDSKSMHALNRKIAISYARNT